MRRSLPTRIVAGALASALVILSPGLEPYRVFAGPYNVGAPGAGAPVRGWLPVLNNAFSGMNLGSGAFAAGPHLGGSKNETFLRHLGGVDFTAPSDAERRALGPVVQYLAEEKGLNPDSFRALSVTEREKVLAEAVSAVAADVQSEVDRLVAKVEDPKTERFELTQAAARLKALSGAGLYFLEAPSQKRVIGAQVDASKKADAALSERIKRTAAKLSGKNGMSFWKSAATKQPLPTGERKPLPRAVKIAAGVAVAAGAAIALAHAGPEAAQSAPSIADSIVAWLSANFGGTLKGTAIGAAGLASTLWLANQATAGTRYILDKAGDLTSLQKNLIVTSVGVSITGIGIGKTLLLMGLTPMITGSILAGTALMPVLIPFLTAMFTKAGVPGTPGSAPMANQIAAVLMATGIDRPFKEGDTITVTIDGKQVTALVKEIGVSRTTVVVRGKVELIQNSVLLASHRIVRKGEGRPDKNRMSAHNHVHLDDFLPKTKSMRASMAVGAGAVLVLAAIFTQPSVIPAAILTAGLVVSILVHEAAHLWALMRLGDDTAARHGVTSINPLKQIDPVGTVLMPAASLLLTSMTGLPIMFGWAKPVPVDFNKLPNPQTDPAKVAIAGPLVNLGFAALAGGALLLLPVLGVASVTAYALLGATAKMNLALGVFNLIPLPNLDGGKLRVAAMNKDQYDAWTKNPELPDEYQSTYRKFYEGPATLLSKLHRHAPGHVNGLTRFISFSLFAGAMVAGFYFLGLPLMFLILPCSYDYYCIREKIQNEAAVNEIRDIMRSMAAALAKAAEEDADVKSEIDTYEVEHILKNALEDLIDQVVDSEGFAELTEDQKWERLSGQYLDAAVKALHESPKGMSKDSPETIRRLLTGPVGQEFLAKIKQWVDRNEVWTKWKSPKRKGTGLGEAVKKDKVKDGNGMSARLFSGKNRMADAPKADDSKKKTFEEALDDPALQLSDKEKGFLLMHLKEMTLEHKPPVVGRVDEMDQLVTTVTSPRGVINSVVLVGKAGVGKTAVAEKLAQAMAVSDAQAAPGTFSLKRMNGRYLVKLNLGRLLQSDDPAKALDLLLQLLGKLNDGDKRKGNKVLLFIDEVHQIFEHPKGAQMANLMKEPLRDGEITIIAATTENEYRQYMEKDDAFQRRLIRIDLKESTTPETMRALQGTKGYYEGLFELSISPEALKAAADLSKYDQEVYLPGRAFKYLVLAAAQASHDGQRDRLSLRIQDAMSDLQYASGELSQHLAKSSLITKDLKEQEPTAIELYNWVVSLTKTIVDLYKKRDAVPTSGKPTLTEDMVKEEIARKTGVASGQLTMGNEPMEKYLKMEETLSKRVVGQEEPVSVISEAVRKNKAGLSDPKRPLGVFYLTGPTGTGKTHLAKELARFLFKDPDAVIRVDMSEYMEGHSVSRMIGSPPGYVGHDAGGQLTEAVRKRPYSVVLFDEIEKAHQDVWDILLQITGDGRLTDGKGRTVDFKNTIILMTSNLGMNAINVEPYEKEYSEVQAQLKALATVTGRDTSAERQILEEKKRDVARRLAEDTKKQAKEVTEKAFKEVYRPEFQGRLHAAPIVFNRISPDMAGQIVDLNLKELAGVLGYAGHELTWSPEVAKYLADEGFSVSLGARPLQNTIERLVTQPIAGEILKAAVANGERVAPSAIGVTIEDGKIKITVSKLAAKVVERKDATEGAERELFTRVLEEVLQAASKGIVPNMDTGTLDKWSVEAIKGTSTESPRPLGGVAAPAAGVGDTTAPAAVEESKPFFGENEALTLSDSAFSKDSSTNEPRAKDPALKAIRSEIAQALTHRNVPEGTVDLLLRTFEEPGHDFIGWLKVMMTQAKEMSAAGAAAVKVRGEADAKSLRLVVHRDGTLGEKEAEVLHRHFTGKIPADRNASFGKAETWNVMGKPGKEHWLELYRLVASIPGARMGYSSTDAGTDYWIEIPMASKAPVVAETSPENQPLPTGEAQSTSNTGEGTADLSKFSTEVTMDVRSVKVSFDPTLTNEEAEAILAAQGVHSGSHWRHSHGADAEFELGVYVENVSVASAKALALVGHPRIRGIKVHPDTLTHIRHSVGVNEETVSPSPDHQSPTTASKIKVEKKQNSLHVKVHFDGTSSEAGVKARLEELGYHDRYALHHVDSGRTNDWTYSATVEATSKEDAVAIAQALAAEANVTQVRVNAKIFALIGGPTGPPTDDVTDGHASARPAPATGNTVPEAGRSAVSPSQDLATLVRQILMAMHRQGDQRGPTLRMSIAETLAAISTPEDVTLARDWIRFENMDRNYDKVVAAALILAKHGRRAQDEIPLRRAMRFLNAQYGHLYNPAKALLADAYAAMQATDAAGSKRLLKRYKAEKDRTSYSNQANEDNQKNALVIEAMYQALARYGDASAWDTLKADWEQKRSPALVAFAKREKPAVLRKLFADWKRTNLLPEGADRILVMNAIADYGKIEELARLKELVLDAEGNSQLDDFHMEYGAEAYARGVARLNAYSLVKEAVRAASAGNLSANSNFKQMMWAVNVMGEAGDREDLATLERLMRDNPENINYYHEMTHHAAAIAWAKIVDREGRLDMEKITAMLGDTNAVINKAAVEALKLHLGKRVSKRNPLPAPQGEVARSDGEGEEVVPQEGEIPSHAFFSDSAVPEGAESSSYYGTDDEIAANSGNVLNRIPAETLRNAKDWVSSFKIILEEVMRVGFQRDVRVVTAADGRVSVYWVLREAVTTEFDSAHADNLRRIVLSVLNEQGNNYAATVRTLRYLQGAEGAKMGLSRDPGRRYEANRGEIELWLKVDINAPQQNSSPSRPPGRYDYRRERLDRMFDGISGPGGHMNY